MPEGLIRYLDRKGDTTRAGRVVFLLTVDRNGMPHVCLLSLWEMLPKSKKEILFGTYPDTSTTKNIGERGKGTLVVIDKGITYYVKGKMTPVRAVANSAVSVAVSSLKISEVLEDSKAGGMIESGITFSETPEADTHEIVHQELLKASRGD